MSESGAYPALSTALGGLVDVEVEDAEGRYFFDLAHIGADE